MMIVSPVAPVSRAHADPPAESYSLVHASNPNPSVFENGSTSLSVSFTHDNGEGVISPVPSGTQIEWVDGNSTVIGNTYTIEDGTSEFVFPAPSSIGSHTVTAREYYSGNNLTVTFQVSVLPLYTMNIVSGGGVINPNTSTTLNAQLWNNQTGTGEPYATVEWLDENGVVITGGSTNALGEVSYEFYGSSYGSFTRTVRAPWHTNVSPAANSFSITVQGTPSYAFGFTSGGGGIYEDQPGNLNVRLTYDNGMGTVSAVSGATVNWTDGNGGSLGSSPTNEDGYAAYTFPATTTIGNYTIVASEAYTGQNLSSSATITVSPRYTFQQIGGGGTLPPGQGSTTLVARLWDNINQVGVENVPVEWRDGQGNLIVGGNTGSGGNVSYQFLASAGTFAIKVVAPDYSSANPASTTFSITSTFQPYYYFDPGSISVVMGPNSTQTLTATVMYYDGANSTPVGEGMGPITASVVSGGGTLGFYNSYTNSSSQISAEYTHSGGWAGVRFETASYHLGSNGSPAVANFDIIPQSHYFFETANPNIAVSSGESAILRSTLKYFDSGSNSSSPAPAGIQINFSVPNGGGNFNPNYGYTSSDGQIDGTYYHSGGSGIARFEANGYTNAEGNTAYAEFNISEAPPSYYYLNVSSNVSTVMASGSSANLVAELRKITPSTGSDVAVGQGFGPVNISLSGGAGSFIDVTTHTDANGKIYATYTHYWGSTNIHFEAVGYRGSNGYNAYGDLTVTTPPPPPFYYFTNYNGPTSLALGETASPSPSAELWYNDGLNNTSYVTTYTTSYTHAGGDGFVHFEAPGYNDSNGQPAMADFTITDSGQYSFSPDTQTQYLSAGGTATLSTVLTYSSSFTGTINPNGFPVNFSSSTGTLSATSGSTSSGGISVDYTHSTGTSTITFSLPAGCKVSQGGPAATATATIHEPGASYYYFDYATVPISMAPQDTQTLVATLMYNDGVNSGPAGENVGPITVSQSSGSGSGTINSYNAYTDTNSQILVSYTHSGGWGSLHFETDVYHLGSNGSPAVADLEIIPQSHYFFETNHAYPQVGNGETASLESTLKYFNSTSNTSAAVGSGEGPVNFTLISGNGTIQNSSPYTDSEGKVRTDYTHGSGSSVVRFESSNYPDLYGNPVATEFNITEAPPSYYYLSVSSSASLEMPSGSSANLVAQLRYVTPSTGSDVAVGQGYGPVNISITSGGGNLSDVTTYTDSSGKVYATYTHYWGPTNIHFEASGYLGSNGFNAYADITVTDPPPPPYYYFTNYNGPTSLALGETASPAPSAELWYNDGLNNIYYVTTYTTSYTHSGGDGFVHFEAPGYNGSNGQPAAADFTITDSGQYSFSPDTQTQYLSAGGTATLSTVLTYSSSFTGTINPNGFPVNFSSSTGILSTISGSTSAGSISVGYTHSTGTSTITFSLPAGCKVSQWGPQATATATIHEPGASYYYFEYATVPTTMPPQDTQTLVATLMYYDGVNSNPAGENVGPITVSQGNGNGSINSYNNYTNGSSQILISYTHAGGWGSLHLEADANHLGSNGSPVAADLEIIPQSHYFFETANPYIAVSSGESAILRSTLKYFDSSSNSSSPAPGGIQINFSVPNGGGNFYPNYGYTSGDGQIEGTYYHNGGSGIARFEANGYLNYDGNTAYTEFNISEAPPSYYYMNVSSNVSTVMTSGSSANLVAELRKITPSTGSDVAVGQGFGPVNISVTSGGGNLSDVTTHTDSSGKVYATYTHYWGPTNIHFEASGYLGSNGSNAYADITVTDPPPPPFYYFTNYNGPSSLALGEAASPAPSAELWYNDGLNNTSYVTTYTTSYTHAGGDGFVHFEAPGYNGSNGQPAMADFTITDSGQYSFSPDTQTQYLSAGGTATLSTVLTYSSSFTGTINPNGFPVNFSSSTGTLSATSGSTSAGGISVDYTHSTGTSTITFSLPAGCKVSQWGPEATATATIFEDVSQSFPPSVLINGVLALPGDGNGGYHMDEYNSQGHFFWHIIIGVGGSVTIDSGYEGPPENNYQSWSGSYSNNVFFIDGLSVQGIDSNANPWPSGSYYYFTPPSSTVTTTPGGQLTLTGQLKFHNAQTSIDSAILNGWARFVKTSGNANFEPIAYISDVSGNLSTTYTHGTGTTVIRLESPWFKGSDGQDAHAEFTIQDMNGYYYFDPASASLSYTPQNSGWNEHSFSPSTTGANITSSQDGSRLITSGGYMWGYGPLMYGSYDGGATWESMTLPSNAGLPILAASNDAQKLVMVDYGNIFTSTDSGGSWTQQASGRQWNCVASSSDGTKLVAGEQAGPDQGSIWTSSDSGVTWTQQPASVGLWCTSIASSSDGTRLIANSWDLVNNSSVTTGTLRVSSDSGITWTECTSAGQRGWTNVESSADGSRLIALENEYINGAWVGAVWISTDYGATWSQSTSGAGSWQQIDCSDDGSTLAVAHWGGGLGSGSYILVSTDYGASWAQQTEPGNNDWVAITVSGNGSRIAANTFGGPVWTCGSASGMPIQAQLVFHDNNSGSDSFVPNVGPISYAVLSGDGSLTNGSQNTNNSGYATGIYTHGSTSTTEVEILAPNYLGSNGLPARSVLTISQ
jgi:hypothetical protein